MKGSDRGEVIYETDTEHQYVRVVEEPGSEEVADHGGTSADAHVLAVRGLAGRRDRLGGRGIDGGPLPKANMEAGLVDVGDRKFLVYSNYDAILAYNCSHHYALSVAMLADRLM